MKFERGYLFFSAGTFIMQLVRAYIGPVRINLIKTDREWRVVS